MHVSVNVYMYVCMQNLVMYKKIATVMNDMIVSAG